MPYDNDQILTLDEVAELTRIPVSTLRYYRHRGDLGVPLFKLGRRLVARRSEVETWIAQQRQADRR